MAVTTATLAVKDGNNAPQSIAALSDPAGLLRYAVALDTPGVASYRAAANFTPLSTAAVALITIQGSATKTVRIKRIGIGGVSTAIAQSILQIVRGTGLGTGGTAVAPTVAKMDSGTVAASTAVVQHYTTAAQSGVSGAGGPITMLNVFTGVVTTPATAGVGGLQWLFPENGIGAGNSLVLRGTGDFIEVQNKTPTNLSTATVYAYFVEWEEDGS